MAMGPWWRTTWSVPLLTVAFAFLLHGAAALVASSDFPLGGNSTVVLYYQHGIPAKTEIVLNATRVGLQRPRVAAAIRFVNGTGGLEKFSTCSLVVLIGDATVWASDRYGGKFVAQGFCRLELTDDGDLRLTDGRGTVGWSSATAGRGVKVLRLFRTGNLCLLATNKKCVWQSFDNPTDKLLRGQRIPLPYSFTTTVTKMPTAFFSLVLEGHKLTANLQAGRSSYTYWEFTPPSNRSMEFVEMDVLGLNFLDQQRSLVAVITSQIKAVNDFFGLGGDGNLNMYFYDAHDNMYGTSYEALGFCELPLACGVTGVCYAGGNCEEFSTYGVRPASSPALHTHHHYEVCNETAVAEQHEMAFLEGVTTVLRPVTSASPPGTTTNNVTARQCADSCLRSCSCVAALHVASGLDGGGGEAGECSHYALTAGVREPLEKDQRHSYWVKVARTIPKRRDCTKHEEDDDDAVNRALSKIVLIFGTLDAIALCIFTWMGAYYCIYLRDILVLDDKTDDEGDQAEAGRRRAAVTPVTTVPQNSPANNSEPAVLTPVVELN
uniref:non-specific serine/threonine protein kinase n=1 Tax=Leersia perrieri TaxID=77586 RepID=A0A0D9V7B0_9ORYZ